MNIYCSGNKVEKKIKKHSLRKILENGGILNGEEFEIMLKEEAEERRDSKPVSYTHLDVYKRQAKIGQQKHVDPNGELVKAAKAIGISFGDE